MTTSHAQPLSHPTGSWTIEPAELVSTITVKLRSGPVTYVATANLERGEIRIGRDHVRIDLVLGSDGLDAAADRDPRVRGYRLPLGEPGSAVRFESTGITTAASGETRVAGLLTVGERAIPIGFDLRTRARDGSPELVAIAGVDHRKLGIHWLPSTPVKAATELVVRARLAPTVGSSPRRRPLDHRYRFMANGG
jgi:hypothetical protein